MHEEGLLEGRDDLIAPCSRKQMSKLGERLVGSHPTEDDWQQYGRVIEFFDALMSRVRTEVAAVDWSVVLDRPVDLAVTGRAKTRGTLLDKLRRTPAIGMGYVRDIAGVRVVGDITLHEQNLIAEHLIEMFPGAKVIDRRSEPQAGYRAVHVIVNVHGASAEIQVRTETQALWAEIYERLADRFGRGIRYGDSADVDSPLLRELIARLQALSVDRISRLEELHQRVDDQVRSVRAHSAAVDKIRNKGTDVGEVAVNLEALQLSLERDMQTVERVKAELGASLRAVLRTLEHLAEVSK